MRYPTLQKLFAVPIPNRFCPTALENLPEASKNGRFCLKPSILLGSRSKDGGVTCWLKFNFIFDNAIILRQSVQFKTPITSVFIKIGILEVHSSIENFICTMLFVSAFKNYLNEVLYDARVSGFSLYTVAFNSGLT